MPINESGVWKLAVNYLKANGFQIHCGCPPGASSYMFKNCVLVHNERMDAPDLVFSKNNIFYFCECKPTYRELTIKNRNAETDLEKLERIVKMASAGIYDEQLKSNYNINRTDATTFRACVGYSGDASQPPKGFAHLAVSNDGVVRFAD
jgi:hypothetical protein